MIIVRNDDVNPNSNFEDIRKMYALLKKYIPDVKIYSAVNIFGLSSAKDGSPYGVPFAELVPPIVDRVFDLSLLPDLENIASHGLWHFDHKHGHIELQEYSIATSCKLLNTKLFVPPFWRWNDRTKTACDKYGITLWADKTTPWRNIEKEGFIEGHEKYLMHSWTMTPAELEEKLKKVFV